MPTQLNVSGLNEQSVRDFISLYEKWSTSMVTFEEAARLRDIEDTLEKNDPKYPRLTPKKRPFPPEGPEAPHEIG
jgi:hypothetical protein